MTPEEFIAEAKRRGYSKQDTKAKYDDLMARGAFSQSKIATKPKKHVTESPASGDRPFLKNNFFAGVGKSIYDTGMGIGNLVGIVSDEEIAEQRRLNAPLMDTLPGQVGNVVGHATQVLAPAGVAGALSKIPSAGSGLLNLAANTLANPQTYKAAAGIGGAYGFVQPSLDLNERLMSTALGAGGGAAGLLGGRVLQGGAQGAKAFIEPLTSRGKDRVVSRYLTDQIRNTDDALTSLSNVKQYLPGSPVTTSEAMMDPAITQMTKTARGLNPMFKSRMVDIERMQNNARVGAMEGLLQPSLKTARNNMAKAATKQFKGVDVNVKPLKDMIDGMKQQSAMDDSAMKVLNHVSGKLKDADNMELSQLYELRKTLTTDKLPKLDGFDAKTLINIGKRIDEIASSQSGVYGDYLKRYAAMSVPDNQNSVVNEIIKRSTMPMQNTAEEVIQGANPLQLSPGALARSLKQNEKLVKAATGFRKSKGINETLTPSQGQTIRDVSADLTRSAKAKTLGGPTGSDTAENLAGQNIANRALRGLVPDWLVSHVSKGMPARAANIAYGGSNDAMYDLANEALINPELMKRLIMLESNNRLPQEVFNAIGLLGSSGGTGGAVGLLGQ